MYGERASIYRQAVTALPGGISSHLQCAYPGCEERPQPRVPGRSGPPPRYCGNPAHNPETARRARARATSDKASRVAATAAALAENVAPEGRVRQLVRQWAVATREAAVAAEAQADLLTAAADALDHYRDDVTVEARITQAAAEGHAALAAQLRAEEQGRLVLQRQLWRGLSAVAVVGGAGLGLASSAPPGPVGGVVQIRPWSVDEDVEQPPQLGHGQGDELAVPGSGPPFFAVARVADR